MFELCLLLNGMLNSNGLRPSRGQSWPAALQTASVTVTVPNDPAETTVQEWPRDTTGMEGKCRNVRGFLSMGHRN